MGGIFSIQLQNTTNVAKIINQTTIETITNCNTEAGVSQIFRVSGDFNVLSNIFLNQTTKETMTCFGQTVNQVQLAANIANNLQQDTERSSSTDFTLSFGVSFQNVYNYSEAVQQNFIRTINNCNQNWSHKQEIDVSGNYNAILNATMQSDAQFFSECMFGNKNLTQISSDISNDINQSASMTVGWAATITTIVVVLVITGAVVSSVYAIAKIVNGTRNAEEQCFKYPADQQAACEDRNRRWRELQIKKEEEREEKRLRVKGATSGQPNPTLTAIASAVGTAVGAGVAARTGGARA